jgi:hypothetical protein
MDTPTPAPRPGSDAAHVISPNYAGPDRRAAGPDRRTRAALAAASAPASPATTPAAPEAPGVTGLERRRGPGRRLSDFMKAAEEGHLTKEQFLFLMAIEQFKRANQVGFPAWTDVLEVLRLLGYRKTQPSELRLSAAEDWREAPDAPSNVRTQRQLQRQAQAEELAEALADDAPAAAQPRATKAAPRSRAA